MSRLMISAMGSGSGKTVLTAGLLAAFSRRGLALRSFKCGPDYLDPMFHSRVLGLPCRNLDLFLMGEANVRAAVLGGASEGARPEGAAMEGISEGAHPEGAAMEDISEGAPPEGSGRPAGGSLDLLEGAMGFYDGIGGSLRNSAWEIAELTGTPVILAVRSHGQSLTLAAQIQGMMDFGRRRSLREENCGGNWNLAPEESLPRAGRPEEPGRRPQSGAPEESLTRAGETGESGEPAWIQEFEAPEALRSSSGIAGVILVDCKPSLYMHLSSVLQRETGLPVFGYLPPMEEARFPERHLGLITAEEIGDFRERLSAIADQMEKTVDLDGLLEAAAAAGPSETDRNRREERGCKKEAGAAGPSEADRNRREKRGCKKEAGAAGPSETDRNRREKDSCGKESGALPLRIAVARDEAFSFIYEESLLALREAGAEPVFFSPLRDPALPPDVRGLYLPGGYPELYVRELSANASLREEIRRRVGAGLPTVAECGGFLYLGQSLEGPGENRFEDQNPQNVSALPAQDPPSSKSSAGSSSSPKSFAGSSASPKSPAGSSSSSKSPAGSSSSPKSPAGSLSLAASSSGEVCAEASSQRGFPMVGLLPGHGFPKGRLVRFGYKELAAGEDSLLLRRGERLPVHEFHHWETTAPGEAFAVEKPWNEGRDWGTCGFASPTLWAAFPHLSFRGELPLAERFADACRRGNGSHSGGRRDE